MPIIGIPVVPNDVVTPSRLVATPAHSTVSGPCCDTFPATTQSPTLLSCENQNVLSVEPTQTFKQPLFGRIRTIRVQAGQQAVLAWTMHDRQGNPLKLTDCVCQPTTISSLSSDSSVGSETVVVINDCQLKLKFRLREQIAIGRCTQARGEYDVAIEDVDTGKVRVTLPRDATLYPGIYSGEIAVLGIGDDGEEYVYFSNVFYVAIERGQWSGSRSHGLGPPTFAEVRLHLRDSNSAENLLLADLMFDDAEITMAITRPIEYWNEVPPPVRRFSTQNFPYRYHWLEAIAGELFLMASEGYRRNHLAYSAAGVSIDDQNKQMDYMQASQQRLTNWRTFVKSKKAEINLENAYGEVGSGYMSRPSF